MKEFKKVIYFIPLLVALLVIYGAVSGKLQIFIEKSKDKFEENIPSEKNNHENPIPAGRIVLREYFDNWDVEPLVEEYNPDNKIAKNLVYGRTMDESSHITEHYKRQEKMTGETKIPTEYLGSDIYNKGVIKKWGESFEIDYTEATYKYDNVIVRDDFVGLDSKYYTENKEQLLNCLDNEGKLVDTVMVSMEDGKEIRDVPCKLVMFDITIKPESEWVIEAETVPELQFLNENGDALEKITEYCGKYGELDITNARPIYYDLGLYDVETAGVNEDIYNYPMRKGEEVNFKVGYIVPIELLDSAYLVYNPDCYIATEYSYAAQDMAIYKIN